MPPRKYPEFAHLSAEEYRLAVNRARYSVNKKSLIQYHAKNPNPRKVGRPRKEVDTPPPPKKPIGRPRKTFADLPSETI